MTPEELENRLLDFSVNVIRMARGLPHDFAMDHLGKQLIRSASAPLLNYSEAQRAESAKDFVHKMRLCLKELHESYSNLRLLHKLESTNCDGSLIKECDELIRIFMSSIRTTERNRLNARSRK
jgi:four helix bundle protein